MHVPTPEAFCNIMTPCFNEKLAAVVMDQRFRPPGGGVLTPNFGRYVPRQSEKMARAPERAPGRA